MILTDSEKRNILKIEIERLCKKKYCRGLTKEENEKYEKYCDLYKKLGEKKQWRIKF